MSSAAKRDTPADKAAAVVERTDLLVLMEGEPEPIGFVNLCANSASFADARAAILSNRLLSRSDWGFVITVAGVSVPLTLAQEAHRHVGSSRLTVRKSSLVHRCVKNNVGMTEETSAEPRPGSESTLKPVDGPRASIRHVQPPKSAGLWSVLGAIGLVLYALLAAAVLHQSSNSNHAPPIS